MKDGIKKVVTGPREEWGGGNESQSKINIYISQIRV